MKFEFRYTSDLEAKCKPVEIELNTLEELLNLIKRISFEEPHRDNGGMKTNEIIIGYDKDADSYYIEVYDDYRE